MKGHSRGIRTLDFHPVADNVLVSSAVDLTLKLWDIEAQKESQSIHDKFEDQVLNLSFNYDGSLIATASRDKVLRVIDPRSNATIAMGCGHEGNKGQRIVWCNRDRGDYLFSTGCNARSDRQICLWDSRNLLDPIKTTHMYVLFSPPRSL